MKRLLLVVFLFFLVVDLNGQKEEGQGIVERFLSQKQTPLRQYTAIRYLEANNKRLGMFASMTVETRLERDRFSYSIVTESGSGYLRGIFRRVLNGERELSVKKGEDKTSLVAENYSFKLLKGNNAGVWKLWAIPRHKDSLVKRCFLFVDFAGTAIRFENELAHPPFGVSEAVSEIIFTHIDGVRLPVLIRSSANIFIAGPSTFQMRYLYTSVNNQEVLEPK